MRQRTLPEQRELLRGLGQTRAAAEPPRKMGAGNVGAGKVGGGQGEKGGGKK
jgi:hypothetical protein